MRTESEIKVAVRNKVIGGSVPLICIPLVAADDRDLLDQAAALDTVQPDMVEWRVDGYTGVEDTAACLALLEALRAAIGDIPMLFTCRIETEGGLRAISRQVRQGLIEAAIRSGLIDIVDIELINGGAFIDTIRRAAADHGVKLMLSHHDFRKTPPADGILETLEKAQALGADIAKVAVMPTGYADVLTLLQATLTARLQSVQIPLVTISMAREGVVTRMAGGLFGSDITFAIGRASSAPGQIPIADLRRAMSLLYA